MKRTQAGPGAFVRPARSPTHRPRGWHVRHAGRPRRTSYGGVIVFVVMCEVSVFCVLGKRPMPLWVLWAMILAPFAVAALVWVWLTVAPGRGGER